MSTLAGTDKGFMPASCIIVTERVLALAEGKSDNFVTYPRNLILVKLYFCFISQKMSHSSQTLSDCILRLLLKELFRSKPQSE